MPKDTGTEHQPHGWAFKGGGVCNAQVIEDAHSKRGTAEGEVDSVLKTLHFADWDYSNKGALSFMLKPYSWTRCLQQWWKGRLVPSRGVRRSQLLMNEGQLIWSGDPLGVLQGHVSVTWTISMSAFLLWGWAWEGAINYFQSCTRSKPAGGDEMSICLLLGSRGRPDITQSIPSSSRNHHHPHC